MARDEDVAAVADHQHLEVPAGAVVAAVDGSARDAAVLDWAAAEATRAGCPLRVVHVVEPGLQLTPYDAVLGQVPQLTERLDHDAELVLRAALDHVRAGWDGLDARGGTRWGAPATVLVELSEAASWVVVGAPAKRGLDRVLIGSTAIATVVHSRCPVAVVPEAGAGTPLDRVVVAVDGSEASAHAAEVALASAERAGASVTCVIAWNVECVDGVVVTEPGTERWQRVERRYATVAHRVLDPAAARHPDVPVEVWVRHGGAARTVSEVVRETGAGLVVVGARGRGGFAGLRLGSVSRRVVEQAGTVVAVVR